MPGTKRASSVCVSARRLTFLLSHPPHSHVLSTGFSPRHRSSQTCTKSALAVTPCPLPCFYSQAQSTVYGHSFQLFFSVTSTIDKPRCKDVFSFPSVLCQLYCGMVQYVPIATAAFAKHVCLAWVPDFILVSCTACGLSSCGCSGSCFMLNVVHLAEHFFAIDQFSRA